LDGDTLWKWTLRIAGLAGIAWETLVEKVDRPELLVVFGAMVGLDKVLEWDAKRRRNGVNGANGKNGGDGNGPK
jgi:hypothetical protein